MYVIKIMKRACVRSPLVYLRLNLFSPSSRGDKNISKVLFLNLFAFNISILEKPIVILHWQSVKNTCENVMFQVQVNNYHVF